MAFSFQDGPKAEPAAAPFASPPPIALPPHPDPLPKRERESRFPGIRPQSSWLRFSAVDLRRAGLVGALSAWLVVAVFCPGMIPLYGIHITNVKLAREIRQMESDIASLTKEKERRLQLLDRMEWDAVYWEAMARETGLTREREHVVELARLTQGRGRDSMQRRKPR